MPNAVERYVFLVGILLVLIGVLLVLIGIGSLIIAGETR